MSKAWLKCQVQKGMFSHEVVVKVTTADGRLVAHFVPKESVRNDRVEVQVEQSDGQRLAILPTPEPYHAIPVRAEDLVETP
ncbi:MAG: hypothetical protein HY721_35750 [Planctomycetes bacterium]|nr:hypothetical protein [Planctomycetota bacterium]